MNYQNFVVTGDLSEGGTREGYEFMREGLRNFQDQSTLFLGTMIKETSF